MFGTYLPARNTQAVEHLMLVADGHRVETTWVCGPHGTGKTHLLQATCVEASARSQAGYFPLRELKAMGVAVLEDLPQLDCLCLDDVDCVTGDRTWERGLFAVLREMQERGARLVMSAEVPPTSSVITLS